ncbi:hypothetical protein N9L68_01530 [bacterium]|nr:hypothetical protein [bacterium]
MLRSPRRQDGTALRRQNGVTEGPDTSPQSMRPSQKLRRTIVAPTPAAQCSRRDTAARAARRARVAPMVVDPVYLVEKCHDRESRRRRASYRRQKRGEAAKALTEDLSCWES